MVVIQISSYVVVFQISLYVVVFQISVFIQYKTEVHFKGSSKIQPLMIFIASRDTLRWVWLPSLGNIY